MKRGDEVKRKDDVTYHFDSDEYRHEKHVRIEVSAKSKPFKENKTLWIILLDIVIIFLFTVIILPFIRRPYSINNFDGYSLKLNSFISNEKTYISLDVTNNNEKTASGADFGKIQFYTREKGISFTISALLPKPGKTISYNHFFEGISAERVYAKIEIGEKEATLRVKVTY